MWQKFSLRTSLGAPHLLWETVSNHFPILLLHTIHDFTYFCHIPLNHLFSKLSPISFLFVQKLLLTADYPCHPLLALSKLFVQDGTLKRWLHYGDRSSGIMLTSNLFFPIQFQKLYLPLWPLQSCEWWAVWEKYPQQLKISFLTDNSSPLCTLELWLGFFPFTLFCIYSYWI